MIEGLRALGRAYGSFFLLPGRTANALLVGATLVDPLTGLGGAVGGLGALGCRRLFELQNRSDDLDLVNGCLLGLLLTASYSLESRSLLLLLLCGPLASLLTRLLGPVLESRGLPLLCLPFALGGWLMMALAGTLYLVPAQPSPWQEQLLSPAPLATFLQSLGGIYLAPYKLAGLLVLLALALCSRYLALLTLLGFAASELVLWWLAVPAGITHVVAGTGAVLSCMILGGLLAVPSFSSATMATLAAAATSLLYLALVGPLARLGVPPLAWPFVLVTWAGMLGLAGHRRLSWQNRPSLPEEAIEREALARARGCGRDVSLAAPFRGEWVVYQGFDGPHTHRGPWRYAVDFIQCRQGRSFADRGERLSDYYCFGQPVLAPLAGTVVSCQNEVADNLPGEVNVEERFGNHVLLALSSDRYLLLAHLQQGSLLVTPGQVVQAGEVIGRCGNSGRSPQPHLHLHLQRGFELGSATLPFQFSGVMLEQRYSLRAVPQEGQKVAAVEYLESFRKALHLPVGRRLIFCVERPGYQTSSLRTLQVELDLNGGFWLRGHDQARVALFQDARLLSCFDRNSRFDPLLDLFTLALGMTPLLEQPGVWSDAPPVRLLGGRGLHFSRCGHSEYRRFPLEGGRWLQQGEHRFRRGGEVALTTTARFSLERGLRELVLRRQNQVVLRARVVGIGMRADRGTPGWEVGLVETDRLQADLPVTGS